MRKLFFVGLFLVGLLFGSTSVVLAKQNGTEECDAVVLEDRVVLREKPQVGRLVFLGTTVSWKSSKLSQELLAGMECCWLNIEV